VTADTVEELVAAAEAAKKKQSRPPPPVDSNKPIGMDDPDPEPMDADADEDQVGGGQAEGEEGPGEDESSDEEDADLPEMPPVDVEVMFVEGEEDLVFPEARKADFPTNRGDDEAVFEVDGGELPPVPRSFFATEEEHDEQEKATKVARSALIKKLGGIGRDIIKGMSELKMFSVSVLNLNSSLFRFIVKKCS
jgi:hypothetical protein